MTIFQHERRRCRRKQHQRETTKKKRSALDAPFAISHDNQILTFFEWCQINRFSERTGRRILASGTGPVVTRMSPRRIGVSIGNNARWQAARSK
jgi:hypothetical protein